MRSHRYRSAIYQSDFRQQRIPRLHQCHRFRQGNFSHVSNSMTLKALFIEATFTLPWTVIFCQGPRLLLNRPPLP
ncbi:hypothetical protein Plhal304r1_c017g0061021 [Plasmopara halstedii]